MRKADGYYFQNAELVGGDGTLNNFVALQGPMN